MRPLGAEEEEGERQKVKILISRHTDITDTRLTRLRGRISENIQKHSCLGGFCLDAVHTGEGAGQEGAAEETRPGTARTYRHPEIKAFNR